MSAGGPASNGDSRAAPFAAREGALVRRDGLRFPGSASPYFARAIKQNADSAIWFRRPSVAGGRERRLDDANVGSTT